MPFSRYCFAMSFITRKSLSRRMLLRGAGASVALPLLDAMIPAGFAKSASRPVKRLSYVYMPMGCEHSRWIPEGATCKNYWGGISQRGSRPAAIFAIRQGESGGAYRILHSAVESG
jgi:hypothetical protein